ncbi:hypothetical protein G1O98_26110 [Nostoc sp. UIC10630]|uniref:hypothetical protein n=1 Tax=Nostoc sp. LEGE 12447 TaxID=1828640 RepID=UPI0013D3CC12|nr:hypothetical protein [Nostoc sp. LEGE 12447]MBE8997999.1 hypothetical protein [Nostoc sp. LEGE 12447]NEU82426.1 hypothetical protein [Nostoc sp. UIC 10630]
MKRNPTLPPNLMLGYAIAATNLQNYGSQGRRGLYTNILLGITYCTKEPCCETT